jgi:MraZ protein
MFRGESQHALDEKGRVSLPTRVREELGDVVMLGRGTRGQVNVYPQATWDSLVQRLEQADPSFELVRDARRLVFAANDCEIDKQGRILIPPFLRRYAVLDTEVVVLGNKDHVEIWSPERWRERCDQLLAQNSETRDDPKQVAALGLD